MFFTFILEIYVQFLNLGFLYLKILLFGYFCNSHLFIANTVGVGRGNFLEYIFFVIWSFYIYSWNVADEITFGIWKDRGVLFFVDVGVFLTKFIHFPRFIEVFDFFLIFY